MMTCFDHMHLEKRLQKGSANKELHSKRVQSHWEFKTCEIHRQQAS